MERTTFLVFLLFICFGAALSADMKISKSIKLRPGDPRLCMRLARKNNHNLTNFASSTARSINLAGGITSATYGSIQGSFSSEYAMIKNDQVSGNSLTVRSEVRLLRYSVKLLPDTTLHPVFKRRLLNIAGALMMEQSDRAQFMSQELIRDYGTHIITKIEAGALLEKIDSLSKDKVKNSKLTDDQIEITASVDFMKTVNLNARFANKKTDSEGLSIENERSSTFIVTKGGRITPPSNFDIDKWVETIDSDLVALDRSGDPLHFVINSVTLPEVPLSTLTQLFNVVKEAIITYYEQNRIPGCLDQSSINFDRRANVDSESCNPPVSESIFGGGFQTCTIIDDPERICCRYYEKKNMITDDYSCKKSFSTIKVFSHEKVCKEIICRNGKEFCLRADSYTVLLKIILTFYWCVKAEPDPDSLLFGGIYNYGMNTVNPGSNDFSCPPDYTHIGVGDQFTACISRRNDAAKPFSLPFAGFMSCIAGMPLIAETSKVGNDLKVTFHLDDKGNPEELPRKCPTGFNPKIAGMFDGCLIEYCVYIQPKTDSVNTPIITPIKRPPFVPSPPPIPDSKMIFDPLAKTWKKVGEMQSGGIILSTFINTCVTAASTLVSVLFIFWG